MSDSTPKPPDPPPDLGEAGTKLFREIATSGAYELRPDELSILEEACSEKDLIAELEAERRGSPYMVKGSQGQDVINPMISDLRQHRMAFKSLLGALNLPDEAGETPRSVGARKAAQSRWGKSA